MKPEIRRGLILNGDIPDGIVIIDSNVSDKYPNLVKGRHIVVNSGEASKSLENYSRILGELGKIKDVKAIVAVGGGVVGDISGFVASTYKRGIELINVPTTLLAMVDSSIGGKNGVNLGEKKNYVGTICQPKMILIDPLFLQTLPEKEFNNGVAEIVKYGYLFGKPPLERLGKKLSSNDKDIDKIISQCCQNKLGVVRKDPNDKDYRHILNFGHTIGHAIELIYGLSHGEAISIGMIKELELGNKAGIISKDKLESVKKVLEANNLPVEFPKNLDIEKVLEIMRYDKKGSLVFALSAENYNFKVSEEIVKEFLQSSLVWKGHL